MITWLLIVGAVALLAYDPAAKAITKWRASRRPKQGDYIAIDNSDPTRLDAFNAAETLVAYFRSIGHDKAADDANNTAQWLFTEPGDE
jgi:hypothetical protein